MERIVHHRRIACHSTRACAQHSGQLLDDWSFNDINQAHATVSTNGRPLNAEIELWNGPNHTPFKMRIWSENGARRSLQTILPIHGKRSTVAVRNLAHLELPMFGSVEFAEQEFPFVRPLMTKIQGNALRTYPFERSVMRAEIVITTDGRPLNARIETLQGPNSNKQVIETYSDDGNELRSSPLWKLLAAGT